MSTNPPEVDNSPSIDAGDIASAILDGTHDAIKAAATLTPEGLPQYAKAANVLDLAKAVDDLVNGNVNKGVDGLTAMGLGYVAGEIATGIAIGLGGVAAGPVIVGTATGLLAGYIVSEALRAWRNSEISDPNQVNSNIPLSPDLQNMCIPGEWLGTVPIIPPNHPDGSVPSLKPPPPVTPPPKRDPLVLDLNNNGVIDTLALSAGVHFDIDGNNFAEGTSWVAPTDGLLALDLNHNGKIDSGAELFGTETMLATGKTATNGYEALAQYDANNDGEISSTDPVFVNLRIWIDVNSNGVTDANELKTLAELSITQINVHSTSNGAVDGNQVTHTFSSDYTTTDGTSHKTDTLLFQTDTTNSILLPSSGNSAPITADILALPDLPGYGNTYSLHVAMANDPTGQLKGLVNQFVAATDETVRNTLVEDILIRWAGQQDVAAGSRGSAVDARHLGVLESFWGHPAENGQMPNWQYASMLESAYSQFKGQVYSSLIVATKYKDVYASIQFYQEHEYYYNTPINQSASSSNIATTPPLVMTSFLNRDDHIAFMAENDIHYQYAGENNWWHADFSSATSYFVNLFVNNDPTATSQTIEFMHLLQSLGGYTDNFHTFPAAQPYLPLVREHMLINEFINAVLSAAQTQTDLATAYAIRNALLVGNNFKLGNELGNLIDTGDGNDTIYGLGGDDIIYGGNGNDVIYAGTGNDIVSGEAGNDTIYGARTEDVFSSRDGVGGGQDFLSGGAGNDFIYGSIGNDVLNGGDGDDFLSGDLGNDVFIAGTGNDTVSGGRGDDTYYYSKNDGNLVIKVLTGFGYEAYFSNNDTLIFSDLQLKDIVFSIRLDSAVLEINNTGKTVTLEEVAKIKLKPSYF